MWCVYPWGLCWKTHFFADSYQLEICSCLGYGLCLLSFSVLQPHPAKTCPETVHAIAVLWHRCASLSPALSKMACFLGVLHPPWLLKIFLFPLPQYSLLRDERVLDRNILFRSECSKVTLYIVQLWFSIFVPIYWEGSFYGDGRARHWSVFKIIL